MSGRSPRPAPLMRPAGAARGTGALASAWLGGAMIALLTGATAVAILLAVGLVAGFAAAVSGAIALRRASVTSVATATVATSGDELAWVVRAVAPRPVHAVLAIDGGIVAAGWLADGRTLLLGSAPSRGVHDEVTVTWSTAGRLGLLWWRRRMHLAIESLSVGPAPADRPAPAVRAEDDRDGTLATGVRPGHDEIDGVRQWRDGDEVTAVHWPSTLRSGEFIVRQRRHDRDERWVVTATTGTGDPDGEAARVRRSLDDCMSRGADVSVRLDDRAPIELGSAAAVVQWCAAFEPTQRDTTRPPWWRRDLLRPAVEPDDRLSARARWAVALGSITPLVMLLQPLGYGSVHVAVVVSAVAAGALVTARPESASKLRRQLLGLLAGVLVGVVLVDVSAITGVMTAMRFLMPQLLVALCVVQGFECVERRSARVALSCSALLTAYAAGVRVDPGLGVWLLLAIAGLAVAAQAITAPDRRPRTPQADDVPIRRPAHPMRSAGVRVVSIAVGVAAVVGLLAVVPVPRGPAQLNLPSWLDERRPVGTQGELADITGSPLLGGPLQGSGRRSGAGAGGYPGFSPTMDTSLRGDLGDEVVMRVRAPSPAFWRGQTFTDFDGRTWHVDLDNSSLSDGPDHHIPPAEGDLPFDGEPEFIQTFYLAVDMPNIVFGADRPVRVLLDAPVRSREDGSLRADVVLPAGSAYTVLSHQSNATAVGLRAEGDVARYTVPAKHLALPESFTERTRALGQRLAVGSPSTYDTIQVIDGWLAGNVTYNLDAPVPPAGTDAVDQFLFESRQGFCEQIASATAMMLRSLGIPARIATGYVPSERDEVAGVWISRARDAHAWVEVWFPDYGWVSFDPTASVPLSGEIPTSSIGGELVRAFVAAVSAHLADIVVALIGLAVAVLLVRLVSRSWRRHRRGRWGVLQDRFVTAAVARGAPPTAPNATLAEVFSGARAPAVARTLDESAFAPAWQDDDERYALALEAINELERIP